MKTQLSIQERLKDLRVEKGLTLEQLSQHIKIPASTGSLTLRADRFHQQLHNLLQVLPIGSKPLFEAVILDILQNQLPIIFHLCQ